MKKYPFSILVASFILLAQSFTIALAQTDDTLENVNYQWSFVAKIGTAGQQQIAMVTKDTVLRTGDEFKMMVKLQKNCFVYVMYKSSVNELSLLYPYSLDAPVELEKNYYLPKGRSWFRMDKNVGTETFYILASQERLVDLERLYHSYTSASSDEQKEYALAIVTEIKDIKKKYRTLDTIAERPISIAGNVRGQKTETVNIDKFDVASLATEIIANTFYSKTFTIEHK